MSGGWESTPCFPGTLPFPHPFADCSVAFERQHNIVVQSRLCGTSQMVQWLRIHLQVQGMGVQSLIVELRSHMPWVN